jgi:hypothetical protein
VFSKRLVTLIVLVAATGALVGCGSSSKSPTAIDTAPPAVPTGLSAARESGWVTISWAPNTTDADFAGFRLVRTARDQDSSLIDTPEDVTEYVDPAPVLGTTSTYAVTAVDINGNESAYATVLVTIPNVHVDAQPIVAGDAQGMTGSGDQPGPGGHTGERHQGK